MAARPPRVVVTGIGLRCPLGHTELAWEGIREARSALRRVEMKTWDDPSEVFGAPLGHSDRRIPENVFKMVRAAAEDAGIRGRNGAIDPDRAGAVIGLSKGDLVRQARIHADLLAGRDPSSGMVSPFHSWAGGCWPSVAASMASRIMEARGPCLAPIAACATGVVATLRAAELIRDGTCDLVFAGAIDIGLEPLVVAAFRRMRALARVDGDPSRAVRPWSRDRSGFLIGEGGAILVLEREGHARARGALPYAEIAGGAFGSDAAHLTDLDPDPSRLSALIGDAMRRSEVEPVEIQHVNVHGTATRSNDPLECRAIRRALGTHADGVSCSANKAQIGHLLGGSGAAELAITCLAIRDQFAPPTLNLDDPDPACDLDGTPHYGRSRPIGAALKLSLGFGGHLAVAVLRRPDGPHRIRPAFPSANAP